MIVAWIWALGPQSVAWEGEEEEEEEREEHEPSGARSWPMVGPPAPAAAIAADRSGVPVVTDPTWSSECGSCHLAYSPGLLPARSWSVILGDLSSHFGDDASVDPATLSLLQSYAAANAADVVPYRLSQALARASAGRTPTRILDIGGLRHEHGEVPTSWVTGNPEVRSLSNCAACHQGAKEGRFDERSIVIPGHGRFDD